MISSHKVAKGRPRGGEVTPEEPYLATPTGDRYDPYARIVKHYLHAPVESFFCRFSVSEMIDDYPGLAPMFTELRRGVTSKRRGQIAEDMFFLLNNHFEWYTLNGETEGVRNQPRSVWDGTITDCSWHDSPPTDLEVKYYDNYSMPPPITLSNSQPMEYARLQQRGKKLVLVLVHVRVTNASTEFTSRALLV